MKPMDSLAKLSQNVFAFNLRESLVCLLVFKCGEIASGAQLIHITLLSILFKVSIELNAALDLICHF